VFAVDLLALVHSTATLASARAGGGEGEGEGESGATARVELLVWTLGALARAGAKHCPMRPSVISPTPSVARRTSAAFARS
jgi:hypothetical protein